MSGQVATVVARGVEDPEHDDGFVLDSKEELVGKPLRHDAAEAPVVQGEVLRGSFQSGEGSRDRDQELDTQTGSLALVPITGFAEIRDGRRADGDVPFHRSDDA